MRTIRINSQGKIYYGTIMRLDPFNDLAVAIELDETIVHNGRVFEKPCMTFSSLTGAVLDSFGDGESDLYMVDTVDLPRLQEFQAMEVNWLYGSSNKSVFRPAQMSV